MNSQQCNKTFVSHCMLSSAKLYMQISLINPLSRSPKKRLSECIIKIRCILINFSLLLLWHMLSILGPACSSRRETWRAENFFLKDKKLVFLSVVFLLHSMCNWISSSKSKKSNYFSYHFTQNVLGSIREPIYAASMLLKRLSRLVIKPISWHYKPYQRHHEVGWAQLSVEGPFSKGRFPIF